MHIPASLQAAQPRWPTPRVRHTGCCHCIAADAGRADPLRALRSQRRAFDVGQAGGGWPRGSGQRDFGMSLDGVPTFTPTEPSQVNVHTLLDAHAHLFPSTFNDLVTSLLGYSSGAKTDNLDRIAYIGEMMAAAGARPAVVSAFFDGLAEASAGDWVIGAAGTLTSLLDWATALASLVYPTGIYPLLNGAGLVTDEFGHDPSHYFRAALALSSRWKGIGEIIVHGHGQDFDERYNPLLENVLQVGIDFGVPVVFHWDIGNVDADSPTTAEENFVQLTNLLKAKPDAMVVLAHCGVGPSLESDPFPTETWKGYFEDLLDRRNLFFDLGGMQVVSTVGAVSQLISVSDGKAEAKRGANILKWIGQHPSRFMAGTDIETRSLDPIDAGSALDGNPHFGVNDYVASISNYRRFLDLGVADGLFGELTITQVLHLNAQRVYDV